MKRHEALNLLSHHHHHTLMVSLELKRAGTEKSNKTYKELMFDVIKFWEEDGENHFRDEEEILFPLYLQHANDPDINLVKEALYQHTQVRAYVQQLRSTLKTQYEVMNELGQLLDDHVRLEERELFPMIEDAVPEKYLYQANGKFHIDSFSGY